MYIFVHYNSVIFSCIHKKEDVHAPDILCTLNAEQWSVTKLPFFVLANIK